MNNSTKAFAIGQNVVLAGVALLAVFTVFKLYKVDAMLNNQAFHLALETNNIMQMEMARGRTFLEAHAIAQEYIDKYRVNLLDGDRIRTKYLW